MINAGNGVEKRDSTKSRFIENDAGNLWRQEEKGAAEEEMVR